MKRQRQRLNVCAWGLLLLLTTAAGAANYYVCPGQGENGTTLFSDQPCGTAPEPVALPDDSSFIPATESGRGDPYTLEPLQDYRLERQYLQRMPDRRSADTAGLADSTREAECIAAEQSLEVWRSHLRSGYTIAESRALHEELGRRLQARDEACR